MAGVLYTYYLSIANYEQFLIVVSIDYLAMVIIGGLGSVLGSVFGAVFVTLFPTVIRIFMDAFGSFFFDPGDPGPGDGAVPPHPVRRADHVLPGGGARGPQPPVAQYPELLPGMAFLLLALETRREDVE